ncbi:hypothetical protein FUAX_53870 (plasmid) [Fulvitalea axinellae]|uniref:Uncharacterized protein n=1 Tax=Fulvitalea axinellae TaxID=1182444 RepID=A0AAU9DP15_9BACT|nr:hypothetical protein FUAX_53870 [Fulvitalea axinellae]
MSNWKVTVYIYNATFQQLGYQSNSISSHNSITYGPISSPKGSKGEVFQVESAAGNSYGVSGNVSYVSYSNNVFTIAFTVPVSGSNSASIGCQGSNCATGFTYLQTDSNYSKPASIGTKGESQSIYFKVAQNGNGSGPSFWADRSPDEVTEIQITALLNVSDTSTVENITPDMVVKLSCDRYDESKVKQLFGDHEYASAQDIIQRKGVPEMDKVDIILKAGFLSDKQSLLFGMGFERLAIRVFDSMPEVKQVAEAYIVALESVINGNSGESTTLCETYTKLANIEKQDNLSSPQVCVIENLRRLVDMGPSDLPIYLMSCVNVLSDSDKLLKKDLQEFMFAYVNQL